MTDLHLKTMFYANFSQTKLFETFDDLKYEDTNLFLLFDEVVYQQT